MLAFCTHCWNEMCSEEDRCPRCGATTAGADSRPLMEKLAAATAHPLPETRARIGWLLGRQADPAAVPLLLRLLNDKDDFVRASAVAALARHESRDARAAVRVALQDSSLVVREAANTALRGPAEGKGTE
ncbi:MAG TPA: HEAT repeat domain-containing protein [Terriglobales bacterium]|nr:HEAT repeat domain-containing protein [Terriglobales bacterium]